MKPTPPQTCTASVVTFIAVSEANVFALLASSSGNAPSDDAISPARQVSSRAASIAMSISASMKPTP